MKHPNASESLAERIATLPPLREVVQAYGLNAKKSLGQNFLFDLNLTDRIARCAGDITQHTVFEIGPGPGGLTRAILAQSPKRLIAIEQDHRAIKALEQVVTVCDGVFELQEGDALQVKETQWLQEDEPYIVMANLPYNIATPLLFKWLEDYQRIAHMTLMFQKEVADRIVAEPGTKAYGRLSVMAQLLCEVRREFDISPKAFVPPPKVTSTVVSLIPRSAPVEGVDPASVEALCALLFQKRRKTIRAILKSHVPEVEKVLEKVGINPSDRPEVLSVSTLARLAGLLYDGAVMKQQIR